MRVFFQRCILYTSMYFFLSVSAFGFDIVCVTETWLKSDGFNAELFPDILFTDLIVDLMS